MEAGPRGTSGYRLRSREDGGAGQERMGENDGAGRRGMAAEEKSHLLSLILCEMFPW